MAKNTSHLSTSAFLGLGFFLFGVTILSIAPDIALLGGALLFIGGLIPNLDEPQSNFSRETIDIIAGASPIFVLTNINELKDLNTVRLSLIFLLIFFGVKYLLSFLLDSFTTRRGALHSIPAAFLYGFIVYFIFSDISKQAKLFIMLCGFIGYFVHLLMDGTENLPLIGRALGAKEKKAPALKFTTGNSILNFIIYSAVVFMGWHITKDFFPGLKINPGLKY